MSSPSTSSIAWPACGLDAPRRALNGAGRCSMSGTPAGQQRSINTIERMVPSPARERDLIRLVTQLWDIECGHLLGAISTQEYRQRVAAMRQGGAGAGTDDGVFQST